MTLAGLGKLSPNMVLMGFKNNWKQDLVGLHQYMDVMYSAFDLRLSFAILRCKEGLDFSSQVPDQTKARKASPKIISRSPRSSRLSGRWRSQREKNMTATMK